MTKKLLILFLAIITSQSFGQVIFDTIPQVGSNSITRIYPGSDESTGDIYVTHKNDLTGDYELLRFDSNLNPLDTLRGEDAGRPGAWFTAPFNFKGKLYYISPGAIGSLSRAFSIHKLENGIFTDSIGLNLDTIADAYPYLVREIDNNTIQLLVNVIPPVTPRITYSRIFYLDSNFQVKSYYNPNFDSLQSPYIRQIKTVHHLNDSTWHLYLYNTLAIYNPKTNEIREFKELLFNGHNSYAIANNNYIALGVTSFPIKPPLVGSNSPSSLGFYIMDYFGNTLDTIQFNAFKDTVPSLWINNYSSERITSAGSNSIVYDTNNIFLACEGSYSKFYGTTFRQYFYVVKTDISGSLKWQFIWGGENASVIFTGIAPTKDKGCVISGSIRRSGQPRNAVLIKFGPNGTISNIEVDAPENLVAFYPNPIKDKLHFDYLPEANGQYTLEVIDMKGKPVLETPLEAKKGFIPVQLKTGFYIYQLKDESGKVMQVGKLATE